MFFYLSLKCTGKMLKKGRIKQKANRDVGVNCACSTKG